MANPWVYHVRPTMSRRRFISTGVFAARIRQLEPKNPGPPTSGNIQKIIIIPQGLQATGTAVKLIS